MSCSSHIARRKRHSTPLAFTRKEIKIVTELLKKAEHRKGLKGNRKGSLFRMFTPTLSWNQLQVWRGFEAILRQLSKRLVTKEFAAHHRLTADLGGCKKTV
jgi:hypothetical protein